MTYILTVDGKSTPLQSGQTFTIGETQYPGNVLDLWTTEALEDIGIVWAEPVIALADAKDARGAEVTAKREAVFAAGFSPSTGPLSGHTLQVRNETDKINWLTSATSYSAAVAAGGGSVAGATFRTMANETVTTTYAQGLTVIVQSMAAWGQAIMQRSWELKDQIDAAEDQAELDAIDIEAGWPE